MNLFKFLAAAMVAVALGLSACASRDGDASRRSAGEFSGDAALTTKVKTAIATDVGVKAASNVNVDTYRGVVQLSGFVDTQDQAQRAVAAAQKVDGVKSVKNDLRLKS